MNPLWEKASFPRGTKDWSIVYSNVMRERGDEGGAEVHRRRGKMASGWLTGRREDCREFDHAIKGWQRWFARVGRARLPTPFFCCRFLSFFYSVAEKRAIGRKREDVGMRIEVADCTYSRGFLSLTVPLVAPWDLSGENCLLGATTTDENPLIEVPWGLFYLSRMRKRGISGDYEFRDCGTIRILCDNRSD